MITGDGWKCDYCSGDNGEFYTETGNHVDCQDNAKNHEHQKQMKDFINALLEEFYPECGDIDGATFQDLAEKLGILIPETRHEPCGDLCVCLEVCYGEEWKDGVTCYRAAKWVVE